MKDFMIPRVNIINNSEKEVGNLIFLYENCKYPTGVKRVKQGDKKVVQIPNKHINKTTDLMMIHIDKVGHKNKYIIETNFDKNFTGEFNLSIYDINTYGELKYEIR
ncbi:MAG: hypothetical protein ACRCYE_02145 [Sarcina sp.]